MSSVDVRVVIVAHDSGPWLRASVEAVLMQDVGFELVVVDNASMDGSVADLPAHPRLHVLRNADNLGFGTACNQGAAGATSRWLLFLNPDCELPCGALHALCALADGDARLGLLGAQLLNSDGTPQAASRRRTPRPAEALRLALGLSSSASMSSRREAGAGSVDCENDPLEDVDAVAGALMLLPRTVFEMLDGFDEGYVLHCEDLDLCRRVLDAGYRVALAPNLCVIHHKGTSSRRRPIWVEWQKHRSMLRYFRKFDAAATPLWLRLLVPLGVWVRFPLAAARAWRAARQR